MSKQQENIKISRLISEAKKKFLEMKNTLIETFFQSHGTLDTVKSSDPEILNISVISKTCNL